MNDTDIADLLNDLTALGEDVLKSCQSASEVVDGQAEIALANLESKYSAVVGALKRDVLALGDEPQERGTLRGAMGRMVSEVKAAIADEEEPVRLSSVLALHERWLEAAREAAALEVSSQIMNLLDVHIEAVESSARSLADFIED